jgi:hypothetical protein
VVTFFDMSKRVKDLYRASPSNSLRGLYGADHISEMTQWWLHRKDVVDDLEYNMRSGGVFAATVDTLVQFDLSPLATEIQNSIVNVSDAVSEVIRKMEDKGIINQVATLTGENAALQVKLDNEKMEVGRLTGRLTAVEAMLQQCRSENQRLVADRNVLVVQVKSLEAAVDEKSRRDIEEAAEQRRRAEEERLRREAEQQQRDDEKRKEIEEQERLRREEEARDAAEKAKRDAEEAAKEPDTEPLVPNPGFFTPPQPATPEGSDSESEIVNPPSRKYPWGDSPNKPDMSKRKGEINRLINEMRSDGGTDDMLDGIEFAYLQDVSLGRDASGKNPAGSAKTIKANSEELLRLFKQAATPLSEYFDWLRKNGDKEAIKMLNEFMGAMRINPGRLTPQAWAEELRFSIETPKETKSGHPVMAWVERVAKLISGLLAMERIYEGVDSVEDVANKAGDWTVILSGISIKKGADSVGAKYDPNATTFSAPIRPHMYSRGFYA